MSSMKTVIRNAFCELNESLSSLLCYCFALDLFETLDSGAAHRLNNKIGMVCLCITPVRKG